MDDSASLQLEHPPGHPSETAGEQRPAIRVLGGLGLAVLACVTSWLLGHLPWVVSGFSWPTAEAVPVGSSTEGLAGVRLAIPLVPAFLPSLIAFTAIGSVAAALLPLVLTTRSRHRVPAIAVVLAATAVTTVVVTLAARSTIVENAPDSFAADPRVLRGLVAVVFAATALGALLGTLGSVQIGLLPLAAAFGAGQVPAWVEAFLVGHAHGSDVLTVAGRVADVLVLALLAVGFAISVRRTAAWMLLWPAAIAILWVAAPFRVMTVHLAGQLRPSAGLPGSLPEILAGGLDVFRASFVDAQPAYWPWAAAVVLAVGWHLGWLRTRRVRTAQRR